MANERPTIRGGPSVAQYIEIGPEADRTMGVSGLLYGPEGLGVREHSRYRWAYFPSR